MSFKRIGIFGFFVVFVVLLFGGSAFAAWDKYTINVYRDKGFASGPTGNAAATSAIQYMVLKAGEQGTLAAIYSDAGMTKKTNPVSATTFDTKGYITFYVDDSIYSTVDLIIVDNVGGFTTFLDGITNTVHTAIINEQAGEKHMGMMWYTVSCNATDAKDLTSAPYDTGVDILAGSFIEDIVVEVVSETVSSDVTLAVGLGATNQGLVQAALTDRLTGPTYGGQFLYYSDQSEFFTGALLSGTYSSSAVTDGAVQLRGKYMVLTDASLTYSFESADEVTADTFDSAGYGFIHYWFTPARVW
jgi:hypothetical protein